MVREPEIEIIPEIELQAMWFGGEFGRHFSGTGGEEIEVIQFGHWNRGAGPDFTEVAVTVDGELKKGTLEIDLSASSWEQHGHGANPNFDDVVLHVFLSGPEQNRFFTRNSRHQSVTQLQLKPEALSVASARPLPEAFPGRCLTPLSEMEEAKVESLFVSAAQFRAKRKHDRLKAMADATSPRQAIFQAICEALGFRHNKTAMAILAQRNPLGELIGTETETREAQLFGAAGFMDAEGYDNAGSDEAVQYLKKLWSHWWKIRPDVEPEDAARKIQWKLSGTRPVNHPQRRVGAIAAILERWHYLAVIWDRPGEDLEKKWETRCDELSHPYWDFHYTLASKPSQKPMRLVGKDRRRDILGNVLFPWCLGRQKSLWSTFARMPGVDSNEKLRRAQLRLFGESKRAAEFSKKYYQQQALLQIYEDFCLADASECRDCPFPEQLRQWK